MKAIDILDRIDSEDHPVHVNLLRRRLLDESRAHQLIAVEPLDQREELLGGGRRRQPVIFGLDANVAGVALFQRHVGRRGGIIADQHGGKARPRSAP